MYGLILLCFLAVSEPDIVASVLILEAGGERDPRAMPAVMEVVRNRSFRRRMPMDEVVTEWRQFSCLNSISLESAVVKAKRHPKWGEALKIYRAKPTNYTKDADHFERQGGNAWWSSTMKRTVIIGNHVFYKSP